MILTDQEKQELQRFADNDLQRELIKKLLLGYIPLNYNPKLSNEELGERLRAAETAKEIIKEIFNELSNFKSKEKRDIEKNPAR